jgi:hypothetical protein
LHDWLSYCQTSRDYFSASTFGGTKQWKFVLLRFKATDYAPAGDMTQQKQESEMK